MKYIDLFSGCGGLSLGMESAGAELLFAVEKSEMAARTFAFNLAENRLEGASGYTSENAWPLFLKKHWREQIDMTGVAVTELASVTADADFVKRFAYSADNQIDAIVGGPPCQGFSLAGRRQPNDIRNQLPWEFLDLVDAVRPKVVVIENVVGMASAFEGAVDSTFVQLQRALADPTLRPESEHYHNAGRGAKYHVQGILANALHYGAPQHRPRLLIIGVREDIARENHLEPAAPGSLWRSDFRSTSAGLLPRNVPWPLKELDGPRTVKYAISDLMDYFGDTDWEPDDYAQALSRVFGQTCAERGKAGPVMNHVRRKHRERTQERFALYRLLSDIGLSGNLLSKAAKLEDIMARKSFVRENIVRFLPESLDDEFIGYDSKDQVVTKILGLLTRKHSQRALKWDAPARTVVTLPDDYVHPMRSRTFTVRELARLQGFPDEFVFMGHETTGAHRRKLETPQYTQVGNAISPWLGRAIGEMVGRLTNMDDDYFLD